MSRIDELKKQHPNYALTAIDVFKMISPNQSNKYVDMLVKFHKSRQKEQYSSYGPDKYRNDVIGCMVNWGLDYNYLETLELESLLFLLNYTNQLMSESNINLFTKFASYNERKLIDNNDITSYSSWEEIENAVSLADLKQLDKKLEKEIKKVYEDDEWLSLRPLSLEASMKYGANTKWCTTTNTGQYYARYSMRGILIYNINKKTGYKVACFKNIDQGYDPEFSWWDVTDKKIEVLDSEAPTVVLEAIRNEIKEHCLTNQIFMTKEESEKLIFYRDGYFKTGIQEVPVPNQPSAEVPGGFFTSSTSDNVIRFSSSSSIGIGNINPSTGLSIRGNITVNEGDIILRDNGEERARITSDGIQFQPTEDELQAARRINTSFNTNEGELSAGEVENPLQELSNRLSEYSQRAEERRQLSHDEQLLQSIELGTVEQRMIERMQRLANIDSRETRLRELNAESEVLRNQSPAEVVDDTYDPTQDPQNVLYEAEQSVLPSKPKENIWTRIKTLLKL